MNKRKTIVLIIFLFFLLTIPLAIYIFDVWRKQEIVINNSSGNNISKIEVICAENTYTFYDLEDNETARKRISVDKDSDFHIILYSGDGIINEADELGYITYNDGSESVFTISESLDISLQQNY